MSAAPRIVPPVLAWREGRALVGSAGALVIARWDGTPRAPQLHALEAHASEIDARHPGGVALLNVVVGSGAAMLDEAARSRTVGLIRRAPANSRGVANVVLVEGFVGAAVRGTLSALAHVARPRTPMRTFDAVEGAAGWLAERLTGPAAWRPDDVVLAWRALA